MSELGIYVAGILTGYLIILIFGLLKKPRPKEEHKYTIGIRADEKDVHGDIFRKGAFSKESEGDRLSEDEWDRFRESWKTTCDNHLRIERKTYRE